MLLHRLILQEANGKVYQESVALTSSAAARCIEPPSSATAIAFDAKSESIAVTTVKGEVFHLMHGANRSPRYTMLDSTGIQGTSICFSTTKNKMLFCSFKVILSHAPSCFD
jgi:hypothetical protein